MSGSDLLELTAAGLVLANIALLAARHIGNFGVGIAAVLLYGYIFWRAGLYSSMLLQGAFLALNIYGWWAWSRSRNADGDIRVAPLPRRALGFTLLFTAGGAAALGVAMARWTNAEAPGWDALLTAISLAAQYLQARRHIETWPFWAVVNVIAIGLYGSQGLTWTAVLYGLLLLLAISGWRQWLTAR
jgi:nicotinamide mononucleotide transporter